VIQQAEKARKYRLKKDVKNPASLLLSAIEDAWPAAQPSKAETKQKRQMFVEPELPVLSEEELERSKKEFAAVKAAVAER
jgi:hypothetical protein